MRILKICFLVFILSIANSCAPKEISSSQGSFSWDFGRVKEGRILEHIFILKNDSDKPLIIYKLDTSCGCTVSDISKDKILPGETAQIKVKFKTRGYKGKVQQHVYIHTDNPKNPIMKFIISAEVIKK